MNYPYLIFCVIGKKAESLDTPTLIIHDKFQLHIAFLWIIQQKFIRLWNKILEQTKSPFHTLE
jgi:hypothetical protein